jgi:hypothetical protein
MNRFKMQTLAAGIVALLCGQSLLAQSPLQDITGKAPGTGPIVAPAAAAGALTDGDLVAMLRNLGYEPKEMKAGTASYYRVATTFDSRTWYVDFELSPNKKFVWISFWMNALPVGQRVPADVMERMLDANQRYGPAHFRYSPTSRVISVGMALGNRGLTQAELRYQIDYFVDTLRQTQSLWNSALWAPAPAPAIGGAR